ncbi:hypothetical protein LY76DRAFT_240439 [Colletotrichum caudatum]|nr:hypothetical protein LY76DRAFT_240439 [Colletotrichum caudatum]
MTKSPRGPSLPQARSYHHNHYHLHNKRAVTPENAHQHRQLDVAAPTDAQPSTTQGPKTVVQTVSVIQIVDASGLPIELQTLYPTSITVDAAATISAALDSSIPAVLSPSATSDSASQSPSISSDTTLSTPAATTPSSISSSASQDTSLTSNPLTTTLAPSAPASSLYSSLSGQSNSTIPFLTSTNSSSTSVSTTTTLSSHLSSGTTSVTSAVLSSLSSTWSSASDSTWTSSGLSTTTFATSASSTLGASATGTGAAGVIGGGGVAQPTSPTTSSGDSGSDGEPTPTSTVVGSVVGSLAGAAFLVVLVFLALRWKRNSGGRLRLSEASMGKRGILTGSSGPEGGSRGMIQRSLSYGRSAAGVGSGTAAAARKHSRRASEPSETGERGFVRVSGRKLPSVLQSGGDGYTDPRDIAAPVAPFGGGANDDESVYYRDSRAFFDPGGHDGQSPRLALGSPMRPESGVVVFKESPARTPVTESAPFADPNASLSPSPPPARDPIGRTLPSQDGSRDSRGSASRFQEQM